MNTDAINEFFLEVADKSSVPIVIYNFPGVVAGLDVNSEMLDLLGEHPNIVAVKLTCGGIAKVARVSAKFGAFRSSENAETFRALAGQSDWLVPALAAGGAGCITGLANLYPKVRNWPNIRDFC
jgi:4-hydroxy-2-oxoglutarate aldolase